MVGTNTGEFQADANPDYDRLCELKAFDETKAGVKGILDSGLTKIPRMFIDHDFILEKKNSSGLTSNEFSVPLIDLQGINEDSTLRAKVVDQILYACEKWGFFQVVNHGIPKSELDELIDGVRRFHQLDTEVKKEFYTRDFIGKKVRFLSNIDLYERKATNWRDSLSFYMAPTPPDPSEVPGVCRDIVIDYSKQVMKVGYTLLELMSEALGLKSSCLKDLDCAEELQLACHYYPECPEPDLTMGISSHKDNTSVTIVLQDKTGGLQVLHENQWVDVPCIPGALTVNVGDFLQLLTNDRFISVNHRVLAKHVGPRISVVSFLKISYNSSRLCGPIKELLSEHNPPLYKDFCYKDYLVLYQKKQLRLLENFKL